MSASSVALTLLCAVFLLAHEQLTDLNSALTVDQQQDGSGEGTWKLLLMMPCTSVSMLRGIFHYWPSTYIS